MKADLFPQVIAGRQVQNTKRWLPILPHSLCGTVAGVVIGFVLQCMIAQAKQTLCHCPGSYLTGSGTVNYGWIGMVVVLRDKIGLPEEKFVDSYLHRTVDMAVFAAPSSSFSRRAKFNIISSKLSLLVVGLTNCISATRQVQLRIWDVHDEIPCADVAYAR